MATAAGGRAGGGEGGSMAAPIGEFFQLCMSAALFRASCSARSSAVPTMHGRALNCRRCSILTRGPVVICTTRLQFPVPEA